ncbi:methyl-accepting chemotaxis protein [Derxia lacustris]|uniref:methyl-accepting chemotaxis protein n=1 Tax=Derxia lacustris TaxID=764842 RepID=UPI000A1781AC|nr:methyl-accepting chemotaxis protein [Derxia lacustris]
MVWLNQIRLSRRLALGFGLMLLLSVAIGLTAWAQIRAIDAAAREVSADTVPSLTALAQMREGISGVRRGDLRVALGNDEAGRKVATEDRSRRWQKFTDAHAEYGRLYVSDDEDRRLWREIGAAADAYAASWQALRAELGASGSDRARLDAVRGKIAEGELRKVAARVLDATEADWNYNVKLKDEAVERGATAMHAAAVTMIAIGVATLLIGAAATVFITRSIVVPLQAAVQAANRVADGDLTVRLDVTGRDELADLSRAQQGMVVRLSELIRSLKQASEQIETGASEVAAGSVDLSARTEEQAASLEESSASLEELSGTVQQNAEHASQVTDLAIAATDVAVKGGAAVREVVAVMQDIEASSRKVEAIVGVIDGISFQTNILALNAAVEAARAGDQGRGFAVVASEVRTLAQRSAQAAKEIKALIGASADKVGAGSERVAVAGRTIDDVVTRVERVGGLVREIGAATREQTLGISQVTQAVSQLDAMTQQNSALVEQSTAAADSLKSQARQLASAIGRFRV